MGRLGAGGNQRQHASSNPMMQRFMDLAKSPCFHPKPPVCQALQLMFCKLIDWARVSSGQHLFTHLYIPALFREANGSQEAKRRPGPVGSRAGRRRASRKRCALRRANARSATRASNSARMEAARPSRAPPLGTPLK